MQQNQSETFKYILTRPDAYDITPLQLAFSRGYFNIASLLLNEVSTLDVSMKKVLLLDVGLNFILKSMEKYEIDDEWLFRSVGIDTKLWQALLMKEDEEGDTAIFSAIKDHNHDHVKILLEAASRSNNFNNILSATNHQNETVLQFAIKHNQNEIFSLLTQQYASCLSSAVEQNNLSLVKSVLNEANISQVILGQIILTQNQSSQTVFDITTNHEVLNELLKSVKDIKIIKTIFDKCTPALLDWLSSEIEKVMMNSQNNTSLHEVKIHKEKVKAILYHVLDLPAVKNHQMLLHNAAQFIKTEIEQENISLLELLHDLELCRQTLKFAQLHPKTMKTLLTTSWDTTSPLEHAIRNKNAPLVQLLLDAAHHHPDILEEMLTTPGQAPTLYIIQGDLVWWQDKRTPLMMAISEENYLMTEMILNAAKKQPETFRDILTRPDVNEIKPLELAFSRGYFDIVSLLLNEVSTLDVSMKKVLLLDVGLNFILKSMEKYEIDDEWLFRSVGIDTKLWQALLMKEDEEGDTAIFSAIKDNNELHVRILLEVASRSNNLNMMLSATNQQNVSVLQCAINQKNHDLSGLLIEQYVDWFEAKMNNLKRKDENGNRDNDIKSLQDAIKDVVEVALSQPILIKV